MKREIENDFAVASEILEIKKRLAELEKLLDEVLRRLDGQQK